MLIRSKLKVRALANFTKLKIMVLSTYHKEFTTVGEIGFGQPPNMTRPIYGNNIAMLLCRRIFVAMEVNKLSDGVNLDLVVL